MLLRLLIGGIVLLVCISVILFKSQYLTQFQLNILWWQLGDAEQGLLIDPNSTSQASKLKTIEEQLLTSVSEDRIPEVKRSILDTLKKQNFDSYSFEAAMGFAQVFKDDPHINEQLIIIAYDHPDTLIRCFWQKQLKTGHNLLIITSQDGQKRATSFSLRDSDKCS